MYCKKCGNQVSEGAKFCGTCGAPVENNLNNQNISTNQVAGPTPAYNQNINYAQPTNQSSNSNKAILIISIIIIGFVFVAVVNIGIFAIIFSVEKESESNTRIDNIGETVNEKSLINRDMSFEYDSSWRQQADENNIKIISKKNEKIKLGFSTSNYYYTTSQAAEGVKKDLVDSGATIIEDLEDITINDLVWKKLICEIDNNKYLFLIYSNKYDLYIFTYVASDSEVYDKGISEAEKIYKTLKLDTSSQEEAEKNAKAKLIGEWDWGISGYFVIENDKIYLYKDSSKSMDNVFYGTYKADDKIATYAAGYAEGMFVTMTVEKYIMNGEEVKLNSGSNQIEFAFSPNGDGTYTIKNMNTYSSNKATKVK